MFGFRGGETTEIVARKRDYMKLAQAKWPFLTNYDCSTIINPEQLSSLVRVRSGISQKASVADVAAWIHGKTF